MSAATYTVDLTPLVTQVLAPLAVAVLTPLISWVCWKVLELLHIKVDQAQAQTLETAIQSGINFAISKAEELGAPYSKVQVKSFVVKTAANYVLPKVPSALAKLGITPEGLEQRIEARLPPIPNANILTGAEDEAPH